MKKIITKPDGTTERIEGTAEEIAEYEKKIEKGSSLQETTKKRRILNEVPEHDFVESMSKALREVREGIREDVIHRCPFPQLSPPPQPMKIEVIWCSPLPSGIQPTIPSIPPIMIEQLEKMNKNKKRPTYPIIEAPGERRQDIGIH